MFSSNCEKANKLFLFNIYTWTPLLSFWTIFEISWTCCFLVSYFNKETIMICFYEGERKWPQLLFGLNVCYPKGKITIWLINYAERYVKFPRNTADWWHSHEIEGITFWGCLYGFGYSLTLSSKFTVWCSQAGPCHTDANTQKMQLHPQKVTETFALMKYVNTQEKKNQKPGVFLDNINQQDFMMRQNNLETQITLDVCVCLCIFS